MAISTIGVTLEYKTTSGGTFAKLCDIKSFPNIGGAAEMIETTTLSNSKQTFIKGVQAQDQMEFVANYDSDIFDTIEAFGDTEIYWQLMIGDLGVNGIFQWQGAASVYIPGAGVNAVTDMNIVINPSTEVTKSA